ncbi:hypothetical protein D3C86_1286250 [compost metagenome]
MQARPGGHARHAEGAEEELGRQRRGGQPGQLLPLGDEGIPPAQHAAHLVTHLEVGVTGGLYGADGAAVEGAVQGEGGHIALGLAHATTHVRVHRQPLVGHLHLSLRKCGQGHLLQDEVALDGQAGRATEQLNLMADRGHGRSPAG